LLGITVTIEFGTTAKLVERRCGRSGFERPGFERPGFERIWFLHGREILGSF
jgi:hypothetical protein